MCTRHLAPFAAVGILILALTVGCSAENTPVAEHVASAAASSWLKEVDRDSLNTAYREAGDILQERRPKSEWIANVREVRTRMGDVVNRRPDARRYETDPSRHPEGAYVIVTFRTDFTNQQDVEEMLVMRLNEGVWQPERYIIDPLP